MVQDTLSYRFPRASVAAEEQSHGLSSGWHRNEPSDGARDESSDEFSNGSSIFFVIPRLFFILKVVQLISDSFTFGGMLSISCQDAPLRGKSPPYKKSEIPRSRMPQWSSNVSAAPRGAISKGQSLNSDEIPRL